MRSQSSDSSHPIDVRIVEYAIQPPDVSASSSSSRPTVVLYVVFFHQDEAAIGKAFWQHAGVGISSRVAEYCLTMLSAQESIQSQITTKDTSSPITGIARPSSPKPRHKHYSSLQKGAAVIPPSSPTSPVHTSAPAFTPSKSQQEAITDELDPDWSTYLEERYARNLPVSEAPSAKRALRRRIAGVLVSEREGSASPPPGENEQKAATVVATSPGGVTENDVYLFPSGMAAIWHAHRTASGAFPPYKSVCFGYVL